MIYKQSDQFIVAKKEVMTLERRDQHKVSGIDKVTKETYDENLDNNIDKLLASMKTFSYVPQPVRRTYMPKANGKLSR